MTPDGTQKKQQDPIGDGLGPIHLGLDWKQHLEGMKRKFKLAFENSEKIFGEAKKSKLPSEVQNTRNSGRVVRIRRLHEHYRVFTDKLELDVGAKEVRTRRTLEEKKWTGARPSDPSFPAMRSVEATQAAWNCSSGVFEGAKTTPSAKFYDRSASKSSTASVQTQLKSRRITKQENDTKKRWWMYHKVVAVGRRPSSRNCLSTRCLQ